MNLDWLKAKQTRFGVYVLVYTLVVIAVLGATNFLANRHNKSLDTTSSKKFSLSEQTTKVVGNLKGDVKISYFDQTSRFQGARDLLDRYDNLSPKLSVDYIDPDKKPTLAKSAGVRTYGTIFVEAMGRKEEAKSVTEEELTGALIRALKGGQRTVCAVGGSGEHGLEDTGRTGFSGLKEVLERNNYKSQALSLLEKPDVPSTCTVLLVGGPRFDYLQPAVDAIQRYVGAGGRALIMLDPPVKLGKEEVGQNAALAKLLQDWGVTVNNDLVLDTSGIGQIFGLSEVVPLVTNYESHAIVRDMKEITTAFPMVRSLDAKAGAKTTAEKLFSSSGNSYATAKLDSAEIKLDPAKDKKGPFALAVAGTYNTGNEKMQGRFVVTGSSGWASNNILRFNGNRDLLANMLNWLSSDEDLISIRPKEPEDRRLSLTTSQMRTLFFYCVVFLPLAIVGAGVSVWWRRR
ncbi:MAG: GldG family protein [Acidobacteriia bacterium]|nr:GldG family protein [Terriglobia bacterium]